MVCDGFSCTFTKIVVGVVLTTNIDWMNIGGIVITHFDLPTYIELELTARLVHRAQVAGYTAIVLTVDTPILGRRHADRRNHFSLPSHLSLGNSSHPLDRLSSALCSQYSGASS